MMTRDLRGVPVFVSMGPASTWRRSLVFTTLFRSLIVADTPIVLCCSCLDIDEDVLWPKRRGVLAELQRTASWDQGVSLLLTEAEGELSRKA